MKQGMRAASHLGWMAWLLAAGGCAPRAAIGPTASPDAGRRVVASNGAVSSANPLASEAGVEILRAGGNAIDAAVATAFAIGVVEPQMSGLGGGGGMTIWRQAAGRADYIDFYPAQNAETYRAAFAAGRIREGRPAPGDLRITGVPGNVAGLLAAHERFGSLPRERVMAPAIRLADEGFPINQVLGETIRSDSAKLHRFASAANLMWPGGDPLAPGSRYRNPELAATLRAVSEQGAQGFYEGEVARRIVALMNANGSPVTAADFATYRVQWKRPLCADYHGRVLLSAPPPQTGSQVLHTLELLEPFDLPSLGLPTRSARAFDVMASALRVGIADHRVNDDPNWTPMPAAGITSEAYARQRGTLVGRGAPPAAVEPGDAVPFDTQPPPAACGPYEPYGPTPAIPATSSGSDPHNSADDDPRLNTTTQDSTARDAGRDDETQTQHGETTHISVVDEAGNAVALTQTNSTTFGSGANVAGFFLNDSGYIFDSRTANAPSLSPWRTRTTTISPTLVLDGGRIVMVVGAPGSGLIPTSIVQTMVYVLDYGMDPLEAVRMPRLFPTPGSTSVQLEIGFAADVLESVRAMGWSPAALAPGYARLYMIVRGDGKWIAVADPRHNGEARGY